MRYIECGVNNEFVSGAGQAIGAAGSHHDVALRITFGEMWDGLSMYVTFRDALGENPTVVQILPTNLVLGTERTYDVVVPAAPKAKQGKAMVTVQGYTVVGGTQEANATNTATAYFIVLPSDYAVADDESIDATLAQQLQAEIDEISETVTDARLAAKDAEAWAVGQIEGVDVEDTDPRYENNSKYYAQRADESATEAYGSASAAFASASSASGSATAAAGSAATATDRATAAAGSAAAAADSATGAAASADNAAGSATAAAQSATTAEGYKNTASQMATDAAGSASAAAGSATTAATKASEASASATTASTKAGEAAGSAAAASGSASTASAKATLAESWAVGGTNTRAGEDTNNAKYWSEVAQQAAGGGVSSFNGRNGSVLPQSGDYTAAMVGAIPAAEKGAASGVAELDASGRIPSAQLPSYVDDVIEYETMAQFPETGESGKIYVDKLTNRTYRWGGTEYTEISESLAIGETASTAYAGNKGKANADAITALQEGLTTHASNTTIHITAAERAAWNGKADFPSGGSAGQILTKTASGTAWGDAPLGFAPQIVVTAPTGSTVTATDGTTTITATESGGTWAFDVPNYGTWTVTATLNGETASGSVEVTEVKQYTIALAYAQIYGIEWDGTSTPICSRTDNSANFADPVPYVAGASTYGSPFDDLYPWKDMTKQTESDAGVMVKIPKFWYKLTQSGNTLKVQIADAAVDGFSVCPACMDRGDGEGERDYVLVGRYHCAASTYKSASGVKPQVSLQQSTFRANIHNLGSNVYMMDFATCFTIWLLYIVEFANWNSQATIGKGCSQTSASSSAVFNMGYTDSMPYHTGTTQSSRDSYGGTQYRNIEGLWDNCYDRLTGCYNSNNGLMVTVNPANFAEDSGGVSVGTPASGWIAGLTVSASGPFPCFINSSTSGGGETAYVGDSWNFNAGVPVVFVGGNYGQGGNRGMFYVDCTSLTNASDNRGSRVLKLP